MSNRVKQSDLLPFWVKHQNLSLSAFAEKYRSTFGVETTDASIRVRLYSVRKRAIEAGLTHRIKGLIASWVLSQKEDDFQNLMELELDLELHRRMSVEDWSVFWSNIWAQARTSLE